MRVKNKETGEVVGMHYGPAMEAVAAGTHEVVNEDAAGIAPGTDAELKAEREAGDTGTVSGGSARPEQPLPEGAGGGEGGPADANGDGKVDEFEAMTKEQLLAEAQKRGLGDVRPAMRKDEIIAALRGSNGGAPAA